MKNIAVFYISVGEYSKAIKKNCQKIIISFKKEKSKQRTPKIIVLKFKEKGLKLLNRLIFIQIKIKIYTLLIHQYL